MRTFFIWTCGLLGSGFFGLMIGYLADKGGPEGAFGFVGGMLMFACVRLWAAERRLPTPEQID